MLQLFYQILYHHMQATIWPIYQFFISIYYICVCIYFGFIWLFEILFKISTKKELFEKLGLNIASLAVPVITSELKQNTKSVNRDIGITKSNHLVWIHAVSGGEVKLAEKIIRLFYPSNKYFGKIFITFVSKTGEEFAKKLFTHDNRVYTSFLPIDCLWNSNRLVKHLVSHYVIKKFIVIEHDLWPNLLNSLKHHNVERIVVNFFLKPQDYKRYQLFPSAFSFIHKVDTIITQSNEEEKKIIKLNALSSTPVLTTVITGGNLKYGPYAKASNSNKIKKTKTTTKKLFLNKPFTVCFGSTHSGEDELLLNAIIPHFKNGKCSRCVLIPRHPRRAYAVYKKAQQLFRQSSQSKNQPRIILFSDLLKTQAQIKISDISHQKNFVEKLLINALTKKNVTNEVLIIDALGLSEIAYRLSDIVLIGDSFIPSNGGHNFLEALALGKPVLYGTYMMSYAEITPRLEQSGAVIRVEKDSNGEIKLAETLSRVIESRQLREQLIASANTSLSSISFNNACYQQVFTINKSVK